MSQCKKCMEGAPYNFCCKYECGEHEFCRGCKYCVSDYIKLCEEEKELVPLERVLDDMYSDRSGVSLPARDYFRENYATEEEKIEMDKEDRIVNKLMAIALIIPITIFITIIFYSLFLINKEVL